MKFEHGPQSKAEAVAEEKQNLNKLVTWMHVDQWPKDLPELDESTHTALTETWSALKAIRGFHRKKGRLPRDWEEAGVPAPKQPIIARERDGVGEVVALTDAYQPISLYARAVEAYGLGAVATNEDSPEAAQESMPGVQIEGDSAVLEQTLFEGYEALLQTMPRERDENDEGGVSQEMVDKTVELTNILHGLLKVNEGRLTPKETVEAFKFVGLPTAPTTYAGFNEAGMVVERSINVRTEDPFPFQILIGQLQESVARAHKAAQKAQKEELKKE